MILEPAMDTSIMMHHVHPGIGDSPNLWPTRVGAEDHDARRTQLVVCPIYAELQRTLRDVNGRERMHPPPLPARARYTTERTPPFGILEESL